MKEMNSLIEIGSFRLVNQVASVNIESSRKNLTQTASIKFPRYWQLVNDERYKINVGDRVRILLGYDGFLIEEFAGYVAERVLSSPLEIKCEDEMWKYKQETITREWKSISLDALLKLLLPGAKMGDIPEVTLSPFRIDRASAAKALEKIKEEYGLDIYFRGKTVHVGLPYFETELPRCILHFQRNLPKENTELQFKTKQDVRLNVNAVSVLPDNTSISVKVGDSNGDSITLHYYNIKDEKQLRRLALQHMEELRYDGYKGSVRSFGRPITMHGMVATIVDDRYPERNSSVFIDAVRVNYDASGYRRINELGRRAQA
jgi:hypothetical protein